MKHSPASGWDTAPAWCERQRCRVRLHRFAALTLRGWLLRRSNTTKIDEVTLETRDSRFSSHMLSIFIASRAAQAQQATDSGTNVVASSNALGDLDEIVVNGIRRGDLILPTTVTSDLGLRTGPGRDGHAAQQHPAVEGTARCAQRSESGRLLLPDLEQLFGRVVRSAEHPAHPRPVRRHVLQRHARQLHPQRYGAPISFNSVDSIDIVKGPASVQGGPGAGVGGAIDVTTKMPSSPSRFAEFNWSSTVNRSGERRSIWEPAVSRTWPGA